MLEAAGRELRRAHQFWSDEFHGPWPHGHSTATNVVYNQKTGRARLIDFELVQAKSLPAKSRHAHDLLVFLLDILAIASSQQWAAFCALLSQRLRRSNCTCRINKSPRAPERDCVDLVGRPNKFHKSREGKTAAQRIRDVTANLEHYRAFVAKRARMRQSRRASINCQVMSPGTPSPISLARATRERAKAPSPGIPSKFPTKR